MEGRFLVQNQVVLSACLDTHTHTNQNQHKQCALEEVLPFDTFTTGISGDLWEPVVLSVTSNGVFMVPHALSNPSRFHCCLFIESDAVLLTYVCVRVCMPRFNSVL